MFLFGWFWSGCFFKEHHIDIYIYKLLMWDGQGAHSAEGVRTQGWGGGSTQCYAKQPHLTDEKKSHQRVRGGEVATKDWASRRRKAGDRRRDLVQDTVPFPSPPWPLPASAHSPGP